VLSILHSGLGYFSPPAFSLAPAPVGARAYVALQDRLPFGVGCGYLIFFFFEFPQLRPFQGGFFASIRRVLGCTRVVLECPQAPGAKPSVARARRSGSAESQVWLKLCARRIRSASRNTRSGTGPKLGGCRAVRVLDGGLPRAPDFLVLKSSCVSSGPRGPGTCPLRVLSPPEKGYMG